ncbi:glycosyl-transferase for dystroglycan-domain-containing protein [Mycotypha africana]|uniref:glycosyl-transferase for dystroglycan-domain-containing protein n=1 Tax=Mycotypha africana TaxID=64632 RepID=UPI00230038BC|nr:glycosyl-transferase for dystroglycan-domain-containing protein [Mycotypha africana]KAI8969246.1 glycosyl-transferase for dystroglycan-domain-containing protein [Mycotypha africana]
MGLDNVTPYYFKASHITTSQDITLATLVTRNRFQVLSRLATNYQGPISAAIHVLDDDEKLATIRELVKIYSTNPDMQKYVDVHLIIDKFDRQFNMWRNIAKLFTRTDYLMMLDVDFHLCTNFRKTIFSNKNIFDMLASGKTALVVPAFEYINQKDGMDWRTFPTKKSEVIEQVTSQGKLDSFHSSWTAGHGATNYTRWYEADEIYPVTEYEYSYEPYIIYKKDNTPWCDERFIGYGANKAACLYEIFISGIDYWVLPNDFLIHQSHKYANHDRTRERVHNKELYENFRTEICLRYSRKYVIEDTWYTPAADNMKKVCTNIPKWKYLSGISKEQRLKDLAEEAALKAQQEQQTAGNYQDAQETPVSDSIEVASIPEAATAKSAESEEQYAEKTDDAASSAQSEELRMEEVIATI